MKSSVGVVLALLAISVPADADTAWITGTARTIDGDTIDLGVVRIRLHAIDAPEADQPCEGADGSEWRCGVAASNRLAALIDGKQVRCEALDRDACGRVIGLCFQDDTDINALLVSEGLAWAYRKFSDDYLAEKPKRAVPNVAYGRRKLHRPGSIASNAGNVPLQPPRDRGVP